MEAPRYWAKAEQTAKSQSGYDFDLTGWACSASHLKKLNSVLRIAC